MVKAGSLAVKNVIEVSHTEVAHTEVAHTEVAETKALAGGMARVATFAAAVLTVVEGVKWRRRKPRRQSETEEAK